ncbi:hypothetical protein ZIOFF_001501 [Zingiber officinale]|uniref:PA domain-containing protein n=1 Tax=Zingiber officinale TaxID=94328 RepID=A0A8J5M7N5_ZINOF|nr:hypothetical protein ZIOFF_001501 [Zingiber officinale]
MAIPPSLFLHVVTLIFMSFSPVSHIGVSAAGDASQNAEPAPISPGCNVTSQDVSNSIVIAKRGNCNYEDKAKIAESCGAAALLVINDDEDTPVMVCTQNDTPPNISMPVVMIPKSAGDSISVNLSTGSKVLKYMELTCAMPSKYKSRIEISSQSGVLVLDWLEIVPYWCWKCVKGGQRMLVLEEDEEV